MPEVRNWVAQLTDTEGTVLTLSLTGLFTDSASFAQAFNGLPAEVYYSIKNGNNREVGIGNFDGSTNFNRTTVTATLISGVYNDSSPTRIDLVGQSEVRVTFNAKSFNDFQSHIENLANPHQVDAGQVGADPVGSSAIVQSNLDTHIGDDTNPHSVTPGQINAEPDLGNPTSDGDVLSSTVAGVRSWVTPGGGGSGDVVGPSSSTNDSLVLFDGITGKAIKESSPVRIIDDVVLLPEDDQFSGLTEKVSPTGADLLVIEDSAATGAKKKIQVGNLPTGGGGESNTSSNEGTGGVGLALPKAGINLPFKNINAADARIVVTDDIANNEVDIGVDEAQFNHVQDTSIHVTSDQNDALDGANAPSALNVFITQNDVLAHTSDFSLHLTSDQNEALDANPGLNASNAVAGMSDIIDSPVGIIALDYTYSNNTAQADPTSGYVRTNNNNLTLTTAIYISRNVTSGGAADPVWSVWRINDYIAIRDRKNGMSGALYKIIAQPINNSTWFELTVTYVASVTTPSLVNDNAVSVLLAADPAGRIGQGGTIGQYYRKQSSNDYDGLWENLKILDDPAQTLKNYTEASQSPAGSGNVTINVSDGQVVNHVQTGPITYDSFGTPDPEVSFTIMLKMTAAGAVIFPADATWGDAGAPTLTVGKTYLMAVFGNNDGTLWLMTTGEPF